MISSGSNTHMSIVLAVIPYLPCHLLLIWSAVIKTLNQVPLRLAGTIQGLLMQEALVDKRTARRKHQPTQKPRGSRGIVPRSGNTL